MSKRTDVREERSSQGEAMKKLMATKKGDIWWYVIGLILALVVLIVISVIFTSKSAQVSQGISQCKGLLSFGEKQGVCKDACTPDEVQAMGFGSDCPKGQKCCITEVQGYE